MGKGLTGWLTPAGKYGAVAEEILHSAEKRLREENGYIRGTPT